MALQCHSREDFPQTFFVKIVNSNFSFTSWRSTFSVSFQRFLLFNGPLNRQEISLFIMQLISLLTAAILVALPFASTSAVPGSKNGKNLAKGFHSQLHHISKASHQADASSPAGIRITGIPKGKKHPPFPSPHTHAHHHDNSHPQSSHSQNSAHSFSTNLILATVISACIAASAP